MDFAMREWRPGAGLVPALHRHWRLAGGAVLLVAVAAVAAVVLAGFHGGRAAVVVVPYPHELAQGEFCRGRRRDSA